MIKQGVLSVRNGRALINQQTKGLQRYWKRRCAIAWILSIVWVLAIGALRLAGIAFSWHWDRVGAVPTRVRAAIACSALSPSAIP